LASFTTTILVAIARGSLLAALLLCAIPANAQLRYAIDPRFGSITFIVGDMGLFHSEGRFTQFDAALDIDPAHIERTHIDVDVRAASVDMAWQDGADMLRSADFFDVGHHPHIRFISNEVVALSPGHYVLHGQLEIRGVTQPLALTATLLARRPDPEHGGDSADFVVSGILSRAAYGMVSERTLISDTVSITIRARIRLASPPPGG
jgi:polyisoprenoid-binding protein YceI